MSNHNTLLALILVLTFLIVIGAGLYYKEHHTQHSLEKENFMNAKRKEENKKLYSGESEYDHVPHRKPVPGQPRSSKPVMSKNIPLGYATNMATDVARCSGGINGIMKMKKRNRYGKQFPDGEQMYSFCIEGVDNPFDDH